MWNNFALPFQLNANPIKANFKRNSTLVYNQDTAIPKTIVPNTATYALELAAAENRLHDGLLADLTYGPKRKFLQKTKVPDFAAFEKQVLRFYGNCEEINDRSSKCQVELHYYLEDDTIEVFEPKAKNNGITEGMRLKRSKVYRPNGKGIYLWKDLNVGVDVVIYAWKIKLVDCDRWTKEYLESSGIIVNPRIISAPEDSSSSETKERSSVSKGDGTSRKGDATTGKGDAAPGKGDTTQEKDSAKPENGNATSEKSIAPPEKDQKLYKFLNFDRQVLRFYGLWDDVTNIPPSERRVILKYFLADDTLAITEVYTEPCGKDTIKSFLRRQKVPKDLKSLPKDFPSAYLGLMHREFDDWFSYKDFEIGKTINIFNRTIFLYDCDKFTRKYYKDQFNLEISDAIDIEKEFAGTQKPILEQAPSDSQTEILQHSFQSCMNLGPIPPMADMKKNTDYEGIILRFFARMLTPWPEESSRQFIISFYPVDDTMQIYERPVPNSGFPGGNFLRRCCVPKKKVQIGERPEYYTAADFYTGAVIRAIGRKFLLENADDSVSKFMEENEHLYTEEIINIHKQKAMTKKLENDPLPMH